MMESWLSDNAVMKIAIIAALVQVIAGNGLLAGAKRGWSQRLVMTTWGLMIFIGLAFVVAGAAASLSAQPHKVIVVLLAIGVSYAGVFSALIPRLRKNFQFAELNRSVSRDL